jgi:predicted metallopeptidase
MIFFVKGKVKNRDVVEEYVINCLRYLNLHRMTSKTVIIDFKSNLDGDAQGYCFAIDKVAEVTIGKKWAGRNLTFMEQMQTLAHELVHVKQYFRGELSYGKTGEFCWKKRNAGGYKYENQPWEKEAFKMEKELFVECFPFHMKIN